MTYYELLFLFILQIYYENKTRFNSKLSCRKKRGFYYFDRVADSADAVCLLHLPTYIDYIPSGQFVINQLILGILNKCFYTYLYDM